MEIKYPQIAKITDFTEPIKRIEVNGELACKWETLNGWTIDTVFTDWRPSAPHEKIIVVLQKHE